MLLCAAAALLFALRPAEARDGDIRCYACTTMNADELLKEVHDANWRRWLENVRYVPQSEHCGDEFTLDLAIRSGVRSESCDHGICMKMSFQESGGEEHVWRSCIPRAREQVRADCTRIVSDQGSMEVCTCDGNLCNSTPLPISLFLSALAVILFSLF